MATAAGLSAAASAAQLDPQQMALIKDAATSICNTVKDIKGKRPTRKSKVRLKAN